MKKKYYIQLNPISMDFISDVKIEDGSAGYQYEVEADEEEITELQDMLTIAQAHDSDERNLLSFRHFDDQSADHDRMEYREELNAIFQKMYELGTPPTRKAIEEIHALEEE
ncbi:hypothetical protein CR205_06330 [Alteribacter lacisalsi]|uniref:Uncharacterized protein n=1 Tax=Alteribacter lacisalsi TaxID=2045244 RepID=A0A2W0HWV0_9BACI|nr:hypothetical protein [Alteribacter lacisalsi]PYZ98208.1 hypothetical protein CR205_06330 [Alteribacter lacisalsi]